MSLSEGELYAAHARASERCRCGHQMGAHDSDRCWGAGFHRVPDPRHYEAACPCRAFDALLPGELAEEWGK